VPVQQTVVVAIPSNGHDPSIGTLVDSADFAHARRAIFERFMQRDEGCARHTALDNQGGVADFVRLGRALTLVAFATACRAAFGRLADEDGCARFAEHVDAHANLAVIPRLAEDALPGRRT
jgi:hypothetical protein